MDDLNTTHGQLVIRVFVRTAAADQYGREHGRWRTLLSQYCYADEAPRIVQDFKTINAELVDASHLYAHFTVRAHVRV